METHELRSLIPRLLPPSHRDTNELATKALKHQSPRSIYLNL